MLALALRSVGLGGGYSGHNPASLSDFEDFPAVYRRSAMLALALRSVWSAVPDTTLRGCRILRTFPLSISGRATPPQHRGRFATQTRKVVGN